MFRTKVLEEFKTQFSNSFFYENHAVYEIIWKNNGEQVEPQVTIWRMSSACWISKARNIHSQYVILNAFPLLQSLHESTSLLYYTYIAFLVKYPTE